MRGPHFALHRPHRAGDERNFHAHILTTTREITATGLGAKASIEWSDQDRFKKGLAPAKAELKAIRERWANIANAHLREHGIEARIDHRTLQAQGIDREPTTHLGAAVSGMERRGIETEVGSRVRDQQRLEAQERLERAAELGKIERESREIVKSMLVLDGDIAAAREARDQHQQQQLLDQVKAQGRDMLKGWGQELKREQATQQERQQTLEKQRELDCSQSLGKDRSRDGPDYSR